MIELTEIRVDYLVTHPRNLRSPLNDRETVRVRGAGSALMDHVEKWAETLKKKSVYLYPSFSVIPFYERLGYKERPDFYYAKTIEKTDKVASFLQAA